MAGKREKLKAAMNLKSFLPLILTSLIGNAPAKTTFSFPDFSSTTNLKFVGGAKRSRTSVRMTVALQHLSGAFWYQEKQPLAEGFETTFQFQLTHPDPYHFHGADGFAFVLQTAGPRVVAGQGSAAGFSLGAGTAKGIPRSLAIFFDTYQNVEFGDPSGNYIAICTEGDGYWPARRLIHTRDLPVNLKDGKIHTARVTFQPPQLSVFLDGGTAPVLSTAIQIANVTDEAGAAFIGFTAATGNGYQNHDILSWSFSLPEASDSNMAVVTSSITFNSRPCLRGRTLCTPDQASVEPRGDGRFHIVLPANLAWSTSAPLLEKHKVTLLSMTGAVCMDPKSAAPDLCADASPGAILLRTDNGRIYFSIRGSTDRSEGYFEFDVSLE
jgi:Legume lectin domain